MNSKTLSSITVVYGWLILFSLLPVLLVAIASFLSRDSSHLITLPLTWDNYRQLMIPAFAKIIARSLAIAGITTCCCLILAYPFSYLLSQSKHQSILLTLIIIPFWTSSLVRTYSLLSILKTKGMLNTVLLYCHSIAHPLNFLYSNFAVVGGLVYTLFPFMVLPIFTHMERFDYQLLEAAKDLGANRWQLFIQVFLPNTAIGIKTGCMLTFLPAMTLFYIPNILGGARSVLLGNMIQDQFLVLENWPQGAATSLLLTLSLIGLFFFYRRHPKELIH